MFVYIGVHIHFVYIDRHIHSPSKFAAGAVIIKRGKHKLYIDGMYAPAKGGIYIVFMGMYCGNWRRRTTVMRFACIVRAHSNKVTSCCDFALAPPCRSSFLITLCNKISQKAFVIRWRSLKLLVKQLANLLHGFSVRSMRCEHLRKSRY